MRTNVALVAVVLLLSFGSCAWAQCDQTAVTIESTNVSGTTVAGAGKITIHKDDTFVGSKAYLLNKLSPTTLQGFLSDGSPEPGKTTNWDATWNNVPKGGWTMVVQVLVIRNCEQVVVEAKKDITVD